MRLTTMDLMESYQVPPDVQVYYFVDSWREAAPPGAPRHEMEARVHQLWRDYPGCRVGAIRADNDRLVCSPPW